MKKCLIVGGGLAGLSAAVFLASKNIQVHLIEASPKFGGRAYSFLDDKSGDEIDNGQHLLLGCYYETIKFIKLLGAEDQFYFQKRLEINFVDQHKKEFHLKAIKLPYPFGLLAGLLSYRALSLLDKIKIKTLISTLLFTDSNKYSDVSVLDWLKKNGQNERSIKAFWEVIGVGALNSHLKDASAKMFIDILKVIFLKGSDASAMIIPKVGLSKAFVEPALNFLQSSKNELSHSEKLLEISIAQNKAIAVGTDKGIINDFDAIIFAIPSYAISKIIEKKPIPSPSQREGYNDSPFGGKEGGLDLSTSSILTLHLWLKENKMKKPFYALLNSPIHWVFNHGNYITTVTSSADEFIEKSQEELFSIVSEELQKYLDIKKEDISDYKIIKEKRATFIPNKENLLKRPSVKTNLENVFLAGDWTNTGLPATIEGAIKSGVTAAEEVQKYFSTW
ncbi:MAG: hydroxysqualene dehydroxylase HpnE [Ignavibacteria bacterium]|nr:hydroxysqualene dehydroxylase HpnE [Ignavibacteria bacterium]